MTNDRPSSQQRRNPAHCQAVLEPRGARRPGGDRRGQHDQERREDHRCAPDDEKPERDGKLVALAEGVREDRHQGSLGGEHWRQR